MALFIVGAGLNPPHSLTLEAQQALTQSKRVYLETYTNSVSLNLKAFDQKVVPISREELEESEHLIQEAKKQDIAVLITGDPLFATTHIELVMRAEKQGVKVHIIHNASVVNAVLITGLQGYKFGRIISLPHASKSLPKSPYTFIKENKGIGLHSLILLDVEREGKPPMTVNKAVEILLKMEAKFQEKVVSTDDKLVGCSNLGIAPIVKYATPKQLIRTDFKAPPHCLIIPGKLHFLEEESLERFS